MSGFARQHLLQFTVLIHLHHDVRATDELALHIQLRDSPPPEQLSEAERLRARSLLDGESSAKKDVLS